MNTLKIKKNITIGWWIILSLFLPSIVKAANVTVPQSTSYGQVLIGNSIGGNYTPTATSSIAGGLQTPWLQDINGAGFDLNNVGFVVGNFFIANTDTTNIFPYASTTAISSGTICFTGDLPCRTTWPTGSASDWQKELNYGVLTLTPTTTIPVWIKDQLFASSSAVIAGNVRASTFTATSTTATSTLPKLSTNLVNITTLGAEEIPFAVSLAGVGNYTLTSNSLFRLEPNPTNPQNPQLLVGATNIDTLSQLQVESPNSTGLTIFADQADNSDKKVWIAMFNDKAPFPVRTLIMGSNFTAGGQDAYGTTWTGALQFATTIRGGEFGPLQIGGNSGVSMTINESTGNVGVGDSSPASLLTVGASDAFQVNSSGRVLANIGATGSGNLSYSFVGDTNNGWYSGAADVQKWEVNGTDLMTLNTTGLGIGTTSPWAQLSIGTINLSPLTPSFVIASSSTVVASTTQFIVKNGFVGIGATSSPFAQLSVLGATGVGTAGAGTMGAAIYGGNGNGSNSLGGGVYIKGGTGGTAAGIGGPIDILAGDGTSGGGPTQGGSGATTTIKGGNGGGAGSNKGGYGGSLILSGGLGGNSGSGTGGDGGSVSINAGNAGRTGGLINSNLPGNVTINPGVNNLNPNIATGTVSIATNGAKVNIGTTTGKSNLTIQASPGTPGFFVPISPLNIASSTGYDVFAVDSNERVMVSSSGISVLAAGTTGAITPNVPVDSNTMIFLTLQSCTSCGTQYVSATTTTTFTVSSTNILDASTVAWMIIQKR